GRRRIWRFRARNSAQSRRPCRSSCAQTRSWKSFIAAGPRRFNPRESTAFSRRAASMVSFPFRKLVDPNWSTLALAICAWLANGCSGSNGATSPTSTSGLTTNSGSLAASVTDAVGDTTVLPVVRNGVSITPVVATPSDLVAANIQVSNGNLTALISFAPGTLSHSDTFACLMLDMDENSSTGTPSPGGDVALGYDYSVCA